MASSQCIENPPNLSSTSGIGSVQELGGLKAYVSGPQDSKLAVLLISDVYGYEAPNLRKIADKVAANGFLVVVPDFFYGDPLDLPNQDLQSWLKLHGTDKGCEDAKSVISALRSKGVTSIGAAGFCWGGIVVVKLANSDCIQAGVLLHPGSITEDEINGVKCPISILGAEIDSYCPPEKVTFRGDPIRKTWAPIVFRKLVALVVINPNLLLLSSSSKVDSFVKIYPGVKHGWSVRYSDDDESAVKSAEESHEDMLNWFTKYVK